MERSDVHYMGAGPSPLPHSVIEKGAQAFTNFEQTGLSLVEISHRSPTASKILADTKDALISLLDIPTNYEILFMVQPTYPPLCKQAVRRKKQKKLTRLARRGIRAIFRRTDELGRSLG